MSEADKPVALTIRMHKLAAKEFRTQCADKKRSHRKHFELLVFGAE